MLVLVSVAARPRVDDPVDGERVSGLERGHRVFVLIRRGDQEAAGPLVVRERVRLLLLVFDDRGCGADGGPEDAGDLLGQAFAISRTSARPRCACSISPVRAIGIALAYRPVGLHCCTPGISMLSAHRANFGL